VLQAETASVSRAVLLQHNLLGRRTAAPKKDSAETPPSREHAAILALPVAIDISRVKYQGGRVRPKGAAHGADALQKGADIGARKFAAHRHDLPRSATETGEI